MLERLDAAVLRCLGTPVVLIFRNMSVSVLSKSVLAKTIRGASNMVVKYTILSVGAFASNFAIHSETWTESMTS